MIASELKRKVVLITGGSSGIGFACAKAFLDAGAIVFITGRNENKLREAQESLSVSGQIYYCVGDVGVEADCKKMVDTVIEKARKIDILVNNAGISMRALFSDLNLDVMRRLMDTNFWGTIYSTKFALPFLLANKGTVVGISSIAGKIGLPARSGYSASKFAMEGFLETLRNENRNTGLHVLVVNPGFTTSNIRKTALSGDGKSQGESPREEEKMMPAEEVAARIVDAVVKRKRDLVLSTEGKLAVLIRKWFPGFIDRMVYNKMLAEPDSPLRSGNKNVAKK